MNPRTFELINLKIDGALDAAEAEELRQLLESDSAARQEEREMERLASLLDSTLTVDPPEGLRPEVMDAVSRRKVVPLHAPGRHKRFLPLGVGLGVAAAIVVMFFMTPSLFNGVDDRNLVGTMKEVSAGRAVTATVADSAIEIQLHEAGIRTLEMRFDPQAVRLIALQGDSRAVRTPTDGVVIVEGPQSRRLRALFENRTAGAVRVSLTVVRSDSTRQQMSVDLRRTN